MAGPSSRSCSAGPSLYSRRGLQTLRIRVALRGLLARAAAVFPLGATEAARRIESRVFHVLVVRAFPLGQAPQRELELVELDVVPRVHLGAAEDQLDVPLFDLGVEKLAGPAQADKAVHRHVRVPRSAERVERCLQAVAVAGGQDGLRLRDLRPLRRHLAQYPGFEFLKRHGAVAAGVEVRADALYLLGAEVAQRLERRAELANFEHAISTPVVRVERHLDPAGSRLSFRAALSPWRRVPCRGWRVPTA
mmetsp:Transcript_115852/g.327810  ORF Transcript_115852/g.327810 Transcript_115852/m.327810 type:complete len:249 (-) Transcript_115852:188-934(-)